MVQIVRPLLCYSMTWTLGMKYSPRNSNSLASITNYANSSECGTLQTQVFMVTSLVESVENHFYFVTVIGNFVSAPIPCDIRFLNMIVKVVHFYE